MDVLVVVNNPADWPLSTAKVELMAARDYLTSPAAIERKNLRIFNLCRSYRYQSTGYYVSLLAEARGHRPFPDLTTIQDLKSSAPWPGCAPRSSRSASTSDATWRASTTGSASNSSSPSRRPSCRRSSSGTRPSSAGTCRASGPWPPARFPPST